MTQTKPDFGIFKPVFEASHDLPLLHLGASGSIEAVELVQRCCYRCANPHAEIRLLLADPNWRSHLVAAVAAVITGFHPETARQLWFRFDAGSWVAPQIGAALYAIDSEFMLKAQDRLLAGCPVAETELGAMSLHEQHPRATPPDAVHRSARAAATLLRLVQFAPPVPGWSYDVQNSPQMHTLLLQDADSAGFLAGRWLRRIKQMTGTSLT